MAKKAPAFDFEKALAEIEATVERMEHGDLSLEESLQAFQRGIELTRASHKALAEAEQKVRILLEEDSEPIPFEQAPP